GMHLSRTLSRAPHRNWPVTVPAGTAARRARLGLKVEALAVNACVRAVFLHRGVTMELWGPLRLQPGESLLEQAFDPRYLEPGENLVELTLGILDGGFRPDRMLGLVLENERDAVAEGTLCRVRS